MLLDRSARDFYGDSYTVWEKNTAEKRKVSYNLILYVYCNLPRSNT